MLDDAAVLAGFSDPAVPMNQDVLDLVGCGYTRGYLERFLERFGDEIDARSEGLTSALSRWADGPLGFDVTWDVSVGHLAVALRSEDAAERLLLAAQVGLRAAESAPATANDRVTSTAGTRRRGEPALAPK